MNKPNIAVVVGSLREHSINRQLADALARIADGRAALHLVSIADLPHYNQDDDAASPPSSTRFREQIQAADAVLFVTPEYNRSVPGVLKNAIDIGSRPYGKSVWAGKPAALCGASPGATGTCMAQQHLRNVLAHLDMRVMGQPEVFLKVGDGLFGPDGQVTNPGTTTFLTGFVDRFLTWLE